MTSEKEPMTNQTEKSVKVRLEDDAEDVNSMNTSMKPEMNEKKLFNVIRDALNVLYIM